MADLPISGLPASSALSGTEIVPVVQGGTTKQTTTQAIADLSSSSVDLTPYYKKDGSNGPLTGPLNLNSNILDKISAIRDGSAVLSIQATDRELFDSSARLTARFSNRSNGFGVSSNNKLAFLKSDNLATDQTFQFPALGGTIALTSDISTVTARTININGVSQDLSTSRTWQTGMADTGVLTYAGASAASGTQINIGAATGWIINNETVPGVPTKVFVNYAGELNKTVTTLGSGLATYVLLNSAGVIVFQNTFPTSAERKTMIYLSKIGHPAGTITTVGNEPDFILSPLAKLRDLSKYIGFINNGVQPSANGANLNFNTSGGTVYRASGNFVTNNTIPNEITVAAQTAASFLYRTQTGAGGGSVTLIDPTTYDVAGTSTAIAGSTNQATNQRIYLVPGLGFIVQKGQTIYATLTDAIAAVQNEAFVVYPSLVNNAILIGVLSVTKGCTALNNTTTARFFLTDKWGQVGGATAGTSTATLQTAYNNSLVPQITVTDSLGAATLRTGRASNASNVLEIQNIGGASTTASINGNGLLTSSAQIINGTAGAGYLQLLNQSAPPTAVNGNMILYSDSSTRLSMVRRDNANATDITRTLIFNDATVSYTFPSQNTDTLAGLGTAQTFTARQSFTNSITDLQSSTINLVSANFICPAAGNGIQLTGNATSSTAVIITRTGNVSAASGTFRTINIGGGYVLGTGSASIQGLVFNGMTINQTNTGPAPTGTAEIVNINPTVTSIITSLYGLRSQLTHTPTGAGLVFSLFLDGNAPSKIGGSIMHPINTSSKTTAYTATLSDHTIICDATSAAFTVTLPAAASFYNATTNTTGGILVIKKIDASANAVTVDGNGSETIDGSLTQAINTQYQSIMIQSNGSNWFILSNK